MTDDEKLQAMAEVYLHSNFERFHTLDAAKSFVQWCLDQDYMDKNFIDETLKSVNSLAYLCSIDEGIYSQWTKSGIKNRVLN